MGRTMFDPLVRDIISHKIFTTVKCIGFVARSLGSDNHELNCEAERILKNLKDGVPKFQTDYSAQSYIRNYFDPKYSSINYMDYISRIEEARRAGTNAQFIVDELNTKVDEIQRKMYER